MKGVGLGLSKTLLFGAVPVTGISRVCICSFYGCSSGMSIDGASHPCASLPLCSCPSHARRSCSTAWPLIGAKNFSISAFHQTLGLPYKPTFCMHSNDLPDLHASILHLSIYPGVRGTSLSNRVLSHNGFFKPISSKKHKPCVQKLTRGDSYQEEESLDLESDILEFMDNSETPELFPSRSELMKAGRSDLEEAILAKGGWMVAGWDMEPSIEEQVGKLDDSSIAKAAGEARKSIGVQNRLDYSDVATFAPDSKISSSRETPGLIAASNQASQSAHAVSSLERQRGWEKVADLFGLSSLAKPECGEKPLVLATQDIPKKRSNVNGTSAAHVHSDDVFGGIRRDSALQLLAGGSQCSEMTPRVIEEKKRRWQKSRNGRAGLPANKTVDSTNKKASRRDYWFTKSKTPPMKSDEQQQDGINMSLSHRIRGLEAELVSTLDILKSGRLALNDDIKLKQRHSTELEEASDALEFCETEIMNKRRELRTVHAQRTAFEGKLALELMEFKKSMEEKDKRLEHVMQVVKTLRTARIVWPNPASEVFLAGSYDGWASWRRMEKSSAGVFVTALHLYPGQYEIKFIVDGEWRVDPNRPIIWANGFENNVLTIL